MREIVGLKVGLEIVKKVDDSKEREEAWDAQDTRTRNNRCYALAFRISENQYFMAFMAFAISTNVIGLSLDHYPVNLAEQTTMEKINIAFAGIFIIEMVLKMLAVGVKNYFTGSAFNIFDCVIVGTSIVDIFLSNVFFSGSSSNSGGVITALRGLRLLRIFKLAKNWKRFELLLETLGRTLVDIASFSILLFLFIFCFTLLGLELFAHKAFMKNDLLDPNGQPPAFNFDNFLHSFSTVFIIFTNDGMSTIYYDYYRAVGPALSSIYFVTLVVIGQKILLNLFLAILLENFDEGALKHKMHEFEI